MRARQLLLECAGAFIVDGNINDTVLHRKLFDVVSLTHAAHLARIGGKQEDEEELLVETEPCPDAARSVGDVANVIHQQVDQKRGTGLLASHKGGEKSCILWVYLQRKSV